MARAGTTEWEKGGFVNGHCDLCRKPVTHRKFYYPTYFNGDAECEGSLCDEHYKQLKAEGKLNSYNTNESEQSIRTGESDTRPRAEGDSK